MIGDMEQVFPGVFWRNTNPGDAGFFTELEPPVGGVATWFNEEVLDNDPVFGDKRVPGRDLGWMLAQGWIVTDVDNDDDEPGNWLYSLKRNVLQNEVVLDKMIEDYIVAYNEGRAQNDLRYDDIVVMYNDAIVKTHSHLDRAGDSHNAFEVLYISSLDSIISEIDFHLNTTRSDANTTFNEAASALNTFVAILSELGTGYDEFVTELETILTKQQADLATFTARTTTVLTQLDTEYTAHDAAITALETTEDSQAAAHITAYEAKLDELETTIDTAETDLLALVDDAGTTFLAYQTQAEAIMTTIGGEYTALNSTIGGLLDSLDTAVGSHQTTHAGLVALFLTDYTTHASTSRALLVDLGVTELARINELFDSTLATNLQNLTNRGMYSSALVTQVTVRNARERNEAIITLNDRLAREQVTQEHQLYGEQSTVRSRQVQGEEYQFQMTEMANKWRAQWAERLYNQSIETQKIYLGVRESLRVAQNQFITQEMAVKEKVVAWRLNTKQAVLDGKHQVFMIRDAINKWKANSEFQLAAALRTIRGAQMDIYTKDLAASMDIEQFAAKARESIVDKLNDYILEHANGTAKYAAMTTQNGQFLANVKQQTVVNAMKTRFEYTDGLDVANKAQMSLYKYQLDTRNNLAIGLFDFMEKRTDSYPEINKMGEIALGLGDAEATQIIGP